MLRQRNEPTSSRLALLSLGMCCLRILRVPRDRKSVPDGRERDRRFKSFPDGYTLNLVELPSPPPHKYRLNEQGLYECYDLLTGRVLLVQSSPRDVLENKFDRLVRIETPEGPVFLEKGLSYDHTRHSKTLAYSEILSDLIVQEMVNGATLVGACKSLKIEYATVCEWRRTSKAFVEKLAAAKKDRAEYFHDEAIDISRASGDAKLNVETAKWAAEKGNQEEYGTRTKIVGDPNAPLTFIVDTGIRREGDPGYIEPENPLGEKVIEVKPESSENFEP